MLRYVPIPVVDTNCGANATARCVQIPELPDTLSADFRALLRSLVLNKCVLPSFALLDIYFEHIQMPCAGQVIARLPARLGAGCAACPSSHLMLGP